MKKDKSRKQQAKKRNSEKGKLEKGSSGMEEYEKGQFWKGRI